MKPSVPFRQLFRYATWGEVFLISVAIIGAAVTGAVIPLSALVLGELINAIAQPTNLVENVSARGVGAAKGVAGARLGAVMVHKRVGVRR